MILKKLSKKIAALLSVAIITGCVSDNLLNVNAAEEEYPDEIVLPITLIDYNADNLLFQYDRDDSSGIMFEMTSQIFIDGVNERVRKYGGDDSRLVTREYANAVNDSMGYFAKGLVEDELDANGNVVYKREVVEELAKYVAYQLSNPTANTDTEIFKWLKKTIQADDEIYNNKMGLSHDDNSINTFLCISGWSVSGNNGNNYQIIENRGFVNDIYGKRVWQQFGDGVRYYGDGSKEDALVFTKELDCNETYTLFYWRGGGVPAGQNDTLKVEVEYSLSDGNALVYEDTEITDHNTQHTVSGSDAVTVRIIPMKAGGNEERVTALQICEGTTLDTSAKKNLGNVDNATAKFVDSGWGYEDASLTDNAGKILTNSDGKVAWKFYGDGVEAHYTTSKIYRLIKGLTPGGTYLFSYSGGANLEPYVTDGGGTVLYSDIQPGTEITIPADGTIKVYLTGNNDPYDESDSQGDWWTRNKFCNFNLIENRYTSSTGNFTDSEAKFADGNGSFNSITTCMDYAYYMLNNMYQAPLTDASDTVIEPNKIEYDGLRSIILSKDGDNATNYVFSVDKSGSYGKASYSPYFDYTNKYIKNDRTNTTDYHGLFPLDNLGLNEKGYYAVDNDPTTEHNFHYAMFSHAKFYYDEDKDLFFEFIGDDDVYLFINGILALDLGGAHQAGHGIVKVDEAFAKKYGLVDGQKYTFDFFYLERHTTASNFYVNTNIELLENGEASMKYYKTDEDMTPIDDGSTVYIGSEIEVEYELKANVDNLTQIHYVDPVVGVEVGVKGLRYDSSKVSIADEGVTVTVVDEDGSEVSRTILKSSEQLENFFKAFSLRQDQTIRVRGFLYTVEGPLDNTVTVSYEAPKYAGANNVVEGNASKAQGSLLAKVAPIVDYKIEYYLEGNQTPVLTQKGSAKADTIIRKDDSISYTGYKFAHTNPPKGKITLVEDENQNVLKVYFVKEKESATHYTIEYYKDGVKFDTVYGLTGEVGNVITSWDGSKMPVHCELEKAEAIKLVADPTQNIMKVYFVQVTTEYTIQYFRDGETIPFMETINIAEIGTKIKRDESVMLSGYHFERTNMRGDVMELVADANSNILKVYFVKDQTSENVTQNNNLPNKPNEVENVTISQPTATPTDDMLPWKISLVVVLFGLAGLCFRVSRWGQEE